MSSLIAGICRVLTRRATLSCSIIHLPLNTKPHQVTYQHCCLLSRSSTGEMKRKATDSATVPKAKRQREPEADYCDVLPRKDGNGIVIWPASEQSVECAREFLIEW